MKDFVKVLIMILAFILILVSCISEAQTHFNLGDSGLLLVVMVTVTVVPAAARPVYMWMIAENEEDAALRAELQQVRGALVMRISIAVAIVLAARAIMNYFM